MEDRKKLEYSQHCGLIGRLRRALPIVAYPRPPLLAFLLGRGVATQGAPKLSVVDVFEGGDGHGLMCRFALCGAPDAHSFVAPLSQLALDRRHPLRKRLARLGKDPTRTAAA
jgi:hypothetical protein